MRRYVIQFELSDSPTTSNTGENIAVPDQTLTVRQLLEGYTRPGISTKQPFYFDVTIPTFRDLTDVDSFRNYLVEQQKKVDEFIASQKAAAEAAETQKQPVNEHPST